MLKINPSEFLRIWHLLQNSIDIIDENIKYLKNHGISSEMIEFSKLITNIKNSTTFLTNIIKEFERATGENIDKLLSCEHNNEFYKDKLLSYYANQVCNNKNTEILELCYENDDELLKYCQRQNFINNYKSYLKGFDYQRFGLTKE